VKSKFSTRVLVRLVMISFLLSGAFSFVKGATKEEYLDALDQWVSHDLSNRWHNSVQSILTAPNPPPDRKYFAYGRGEVMDALPLALVGVHRIFKGDIAGGNELLQGALQIVEACDKVVDDGYDQKPFPSTDQISYALPELTQTYLILKEQGVLKSPELEKPPTTLEKAADFRISVMPQIGMGGLSNQINRYGYSVLLTARVLEDELGADASFAQQRPDLSKKIEGMRRWSSLLIKEGLNYPYKYQISADGTISSPMTQAKDGTLSPAHMIELPHVGISEDSTGYDAESVLYFLRLIAEMPRKYVPELTDDRLQEICNWIGDWRQQIMPVGVIPPFGDSEWEGFGPWTAVFETAAVQFKDPKYGTAAPTFRDAADRIFRYVQTVEQGHSFDGLYEPITSMDDSIQPVPGSEQSIVIVQQSPKGFLQPGKVILRGTSAKPEDQPFAMFNTFLNGSHSHMEIGGLVAYCAGDSVFLHEAGYDAGAMFFHNLVLVRPADEPFLPFASHFKDPNDTILEKGKVVLDNDTREQISAKLTDSQNFVSTTIITNYVAGSKLHKDQFTLTREAALDKNSGALMIFDTVRSNQDSGKISMGPLWHVQNILARNADGFLCQDNYQANAEPKSKTPLQIASPPRPVWIGMAGPVGAALGNLEWHFYCRHYHDDVPEKSHIYNRFEGSLAEGQSVSFLTVFVPMPVGTKTLDSIPAKTLVTGNSGSVQIGRLHYMFGPSSVEIGE
jgi:hypothetical protein